MFLEHIIQKDRGAKVPIPLKMFCACFLKNVGRVGPSRQIP